MGLTGRSFEAAERRDWRVPACRRFTTNAMAIFQMELAKAGKQRIVLTQKANRHLRPYPQIRGEN